MAHFITVTEPGSAFGTDKDVKIRINVDYIISFQEDSDDENINTTIHINDQEKQRISVKEKISDIDKQIKNNS